MQVIRNYTTAFRNFMIIFSFIMNFVLLVIVIFLIYLIFQIKNGIAEPLIDGLHSNFVGLNESQIQTNVVVNDEIPINFDLTVSDVTTVTLAEPVFIGNMPAQFNITGGGGSITGTVDITLPRGTPLTIDLTLLVPVEQQIPVVLNVPVDIALKETQLSIPFTNLRDLLEPYVRALDNLPSDWGDIPSFAGEVIEGDVDLLRSTNDSRNPLSPNFFDPAAENTEGQDAVPPDTQNTNTGADASGADGSADSPDANTNTDQNNTDANGENIPPTFGPSPTPSLTPFVLSSSTPDAEGTPSP